MFEILKPLIKRKEKPKTTFPVDILKYIRTAALATLPLFPATALATPYEFDSNKQAEIMDSIYKAKYEAQGIDFATFTSHFLSLNPAYCGNNIKNYRLPAIQNMQATQIPATPKKEKKIVQREATIDLSHHPLEDPESGKLLAHSFDQMTGAAFDFLAKKYPQLNQSELYRMSEFTMQTYLKTLSAFLYHESGHDRVAELSGYAHESGVNFSELRSAGIFPVALFPEYKNQLSNVPQNKIADIVAQNAGAGLNNNAALAEYTIEGMYKKPQAGYDEATAYLVNTLSPNMGVLGYHFTDMGKKPSNVSNGDFIPQGDIVDYVSALQAKGINISQDQMLINAAISTALSYQTWENLSALWNYLSKGERTFTPKTWEVFKQKISSPYFSYFLTPQGELAKGEVFINPQSDQSWKVSATTGMAWTQKGAGVDTFRPEVEYTRKLGENTEVTAGLAINFGDFQGYAAELGVSYQVRENLSANIGAVIFSDDAIHNGVFGEENKWGGDDEMQSKIMAGVTYRP